MELRYCEVCGDVIKVEGDQPQNIQDRFVCATCQGGGATETAGASRKQNFKAENLDLFSQNTIAIKREELAGAKPSPEKKPSTSKLRLVKTGSSSVVRIPNAKEQAPAKKPAGFDLSFDKPVSQPGGEQEAEVPPGTSPGSNLPAGSAQKIMFRCLFCRSPISIRPVERTSKLSCPSCSKPLYVTPSARLLKNNPSVVVRKQSVAVGQGSAAVRKQSAAVRQGQGSVAVKKQSAAVPQGQGSVAVKKQSAAVRQGQGSVAVKKQSAAVPQGQGSVAVRKQSDAVPQGQGSVAVRKQSDAVPQGQGSVAVRKQSDAVPQGQGSVAVRKQSDAVRKQSAAVRAGGSARSQSAAVRKQNAAIRQGSAAVKAEQRTDAEIAEQLEPHPHRGPTLKLETVRPATSERPVEAVGKGTITELPLDSLLPEGEEETTSFLTDEPTSTLSGDLLDRPVNDDFADEFLATPQPAAAVAKVPALSEDEIGEGGDEDADDWPTETSMLGEDEFDSFRKQAEKQKKVGWSQKARKGLVILGLTLPLAVGFGYWVTGASQSRYKDYDTLTSETSGSGPFEQLGELTHKGIVRLFGEAEESEE